MDEEFGGLVGLRWGPAHCEGVEGFAFSGEADVLVGEVGLLAFVGVELFAGGFDDDFGGGAFAVDLPGARVVDGFAVDSGPLGDGFEDAALFGVGEAGGGVGDVEEEVAVLADDVYEEIDDFFGGFVGGAELVVPLADAGVGLPGAGIDLVEDAALVVDDAGGGVGAVGGGFC